jgi:hypothetical protein
VRARGDEGWSWSSFGGRPRATLALLAVLAVTASAAALAAGTDEPASADRPPSAPTAERDGEEEAEVGRPADDLPVDTLVAWTRSRLPEGYADAVASSTDFAHVSLARSGTYRLVRTVAADGTAVDELPDGWFYPVELLALDPTTYDDLAERRVVGDLARDEALLSRSSAEVRRLEPGAQLVFSDGTELRVAGIVADELVGAGEVVVRADGILVPDRERGLYVRPEPEVGDRADVEAALAELLPEQRALGVVGHGEEPLLRNSAGVLAPARMKVYFGEFAMRDKPGRAVQTGHSWIQPAHHRRGGADPRPGRVPPGDVRAVARRDAGADRPGAQHTIDRRDYGGCWVPRTQGGELGPLSSHAWGTSIDFNVSENHLGMEPSQDPILVEVMANHGFTWGGDWLLPDAMHFELVPDRDPSQAAEGPG